MKEMKSTTQGINCRETKKLTYYVGVVGYKGQDSYTNNWDIDQL